MAAHATAHAAPVPTAAMSSLAATAQRTGAVVPSSLPPTLAFSTPRTDALAASASAPALPVASAGAHQPHLRPLVVAGAGPRAAARRALVTSAPSLGEAAAERGAAEAVASASARASVTPPPRARVSLSGGAASTGAAPQSMPTHRRPPRSRAPPGTLREQARHVAAAAVSAARRGDPLLGGLLAVSTPSPWGDAAGSQNASPRSDSVMQRARQQQTAAPRRSRLPEPVRDGAALQLGIGGVAAGAAPQHR